MPVIIPGSFWRSEKWENHNPITGGDGVATVFLPSNQQTSDVNHNPNPGAGWDQILIIYLGSCED